MFGKLFSVVRSLFVRPSQGEGEGEPVRPPAPVTVEPPAFVEPPAPSPAPKPILTVSRPSPKSKKPKETETKTEGESLIPPCEGAYNPDPKGTELVDGLRTAWDCTLKNDREGAKTALDLVYKGAHFSMVRNAVSGSLWNRYRSQKIRHGRGHAESLPKAEQVTGQGKFFANTENGILSIEAGTGIVGYLMLAWDRRIQKGNRSCPFTKLAEEGANNYTALGFLAGAAANYLSELVNGASRAYKENEDGTKTGVKKPETIGEREFQSREPEPGWGLEGRETRANKRWILATVLADQDRKLVKAWALQTAGARVGARHHDEKVRTSPETVYGKSRATTQRHLSVLREEIKAALGTKDKMESIRVMLRMAQLLSIGL